MKCKDMSKELLEELIFGDEDILLRKILDRNRRAKRNPVVSVIISNLVAIQASISSTVTIATNLQESSTSRPVPELKSLNELEKMPEYEFLDTLRLTKSCFYALEEEISEYFAPFDNRGTPPLSIKQSLLITLWYLGGNATTFREIYEKFGISKYCAHKSINAILDSICCLASKYIKWPDAKKQEEIENAFRDLTGIPGIVGVVGGTNVKVRPLESEQCSCGDKLSPYCVNLIFLCDNKRRITHMEVGIPGSYSSSEAFELSTIHENLTAHPSSLFCSPSYHIVGDASHTLDNHLVTPFRDLGNLHPDKLHFNNCISKGGEVFDSTLHLLKDRFQNLQYIDDNLTTVNNIVKAACVLHNFALSFESNASLWLLSEQNIAADGVFTSGFTVSANSEAVQKRDLLVNILAKSRPVFI